MNQAEDVEVILAHDRRYKFHSGTLARNSSLLADMLVETQAAKLCKKAKSAGINIKWMIELQELPTAQYPAGRLTLVPLSSMGERADGRTGMVINENGLIPIKTFDYYEAIFYAFYGKDIHICDTDMHAALIDCGEIIQIAEYLGCVNIISKSVEVALIKHGQSLFRAIQSMPLGWATASHSIKSELIFRESIIHLAGNWKNICRNPTLMQRMRETPVIRGLAEKYHRELMAKGRSLELSIISIYPGDMCTPSESLPIKREDYAKDILVWMALTFFRHWFGQRIIQHKGYHSEDCGYSLYSQLGSSGEAYMNKEVMNQFHSKFPMTKKAMNVLENHLLEIKECIKGTIDKHGILKNFCQLDVQKYPVAYLTCTEFNRKDFPWVKEQMVGNANEVERGRRPGGNDITRQNFATAKRLQEPDMDTLDSESGAESEPECGTPNKRMRYS